MKTALVIGLIVLMVTFVIIIIAIVSLPSKPNDSTTPGTGYTGGSTSGQSGSSSGQSGSSSSSGGVPSSGPVAPPAPKCTSASFFENKNFGGRGLTLSVGYHGIEELKSLNFNDKISSFRIPSGCRVRLFENAYRSGNDMVYTGPYEIADMSLIPWTGGANDKISEIEIFDA